MPSLLELQTNFAAAVFNGNGHIDALLAHCGGTTARVAQSLEIYRRSVLANLTAAVQATYPVIESIVGKAFLAAAARQYALERPSTSGDLNEYGSDFDDFLSKYVPALSLPYLPDVARLEWSVQEVYGATNASVQDLSALVATAPQEWGGLRFCLDSAHAILASTWPLARIWQVNQPGYHGDFQVDFDQAQTVLIHRQGDGVAVEEISLGEQDLILALDKGMALNAAVQAATHDKSFNLQAALQRFITSCLLRQVY